MIDGLINQLLGSLDPMSLIVRIVAALIGLAYLSYGKKQNIWYALCGLGLLLYPYFVDTTTQLIAIGLSLLLIPIVMSKLTG